MDKWFYRLQCGHSFKSSIGINTLSRVECGECHKITGFITKELTEKQKKEAFNRLIKTLEKIEQDEKGKE